MYELYDLYFIIIILILSNLRYFLQLNYFWLIKLIYFCLVLISIALKSAPLSYVLFAALWREMILKHKGVITQELGLSTLCSISEGFTAPHIKDCVLKVYRILIIFKNL